MNKELLKKLIRTSSISGDEESIVEIIREILIQSNFKIERNNLGNIMGVKISKTKGAKKILIDAHIDEVGFKITSINKNGTLNFTSVNYIGPKYLIGNIIEIWDEDNSSKFKGVINFKDQLLSVENPPQKIEYSNLVIDCGFKSKQEVIDLKISLKSQVSFEYKFQESNHRIITKSVDNKLGTALLLEFIEYISNLKNLNLNNHLYVCFSTQEEVGLRGVRGAIYKYKPDLVYVIDISPAYEKDSRGMLGKGTLLRHKDAYTIYPQKTINMIKDVLVTNNIKYQDYFSFGGTNAGIAHILNEGICVIPIGLSARYIHTSSSIFEKSDYEDTLKLLKILFFENNKNGI